MKKKLLPIIFPALLLLFPLSCNEECCSMEESQSSLMGSWLLYERGYSPGAGYIIEEVAPVPAQQIIFRPGNSMTSTVNGLAQFKFYFTVDDSLSDDKIVKFYISEPPNTGQSTSSYSYEIIDGKLKLYYRYCIEGCHLGFRRIK